MLPHKRKDCNIKSQPQLDAAGGAVAPVKPPKPQSPNSLSTTSTLSSKERELAAENVRLQNEVAALRRALGNNSNNDNFGSQAAGAPPLPTSPPPQVPYSNTTATTAASWWPPTPFTSPAPAAPVAAPVARIERYPTPNMHRQEASPTWGFRTVAPVGKQIYDAQETNDLNTLQSLCLEWAGNGLVIDWQNPVHEGSTAIIRAAMYGNDASLRILIAAGANLDFATNRTRDTALHLAARIGSVSICRILINEGAPVMAKNSVGYTALMVANQFRQGQWQECSELLKKVENSYKDPPPAPPAPPAFGSKITNAFENGVVRGTERGASWATTEVVHGGMRKVAGTILSSGKR